MPSPHVRLREASTRDAVPRGVWMRMSSFSADSCHRISNSIKERKRRARYHPGRLRTIQQRYAFDAVRSRCDAST